MRRRGYMSVMAAHDDYLRKVAISSLSNSAASALATALLLPLLIRSIGLASYGFWAILTIFIGIASALDFGIWKSLVYLIPRGKHSRNQLLSSAILLCAIGGALFTAIFGALLIGHVELFGKSVAAQGDLIWWLSASGCIIVIANLLTNLARAVLEASFRGHWVNIGYGLLTMALYGFAAVIARWTHDPRALIVGSTLVYLISLAAHFACLPFSIRWEQPQQAAVIAILRYGGASFFADAPSIVMGPVLLYLFLLTANNSGQYAIFDIALRLSTLAATTLSMLSAPFFAIVSSTNSREQGQVRSMISRHLRVTLSLALVGCVIFWAIGRPLLTVFFVEGSGYIYRASVIMLIGSAAAAALEPVTRMLMGIGQLGKLSLVRAAMLGSALLSVAVLRKVDPLDRFAISCAIGFSIAAIGLWALNRTEQWGASRSA
jgi:O-antigen/teichoic acid export membrane protein